MNQPDRGVRGTAQVDHFVRHGASVLGALLVVAIAAAVLVAMPDISRHAAGPSERTAGGSGGPPQQTVVPWLALVPPAASALPAPAVPACRALDISGGSLQFAGVATGSEGFSGTVSLRASQPCDLPGSPSVTVMDAQGSPISGQVLGNPASAPVELDATGARVTLLVDNWCASGKPARVDVTLIGGDSISLPLGAGPAAEGCTGSPIYSLKFASASIAASSPPSALDALQPRIISSGTASAGHDYDYVVVLTNTGVSAIDLQPCPDYDEGIKFLSGSGYSLRYQLNCAAASAIPAGVSEAFDMTIAVPATAQSGSYLLTWGLEGTSLVANNEVVVR